MFDSGAIPMPKPILDRRTGPRLSLSALSAKFYVHLSELRSIQMIDCVPLSYRHSRSMALAIDKFSCYVVSHSISEFANDRGQYSIGRLVDFGY